MAFLRSIFRRRRSQAAVRQATPAPQPRPLRGVEVMEPRRLLSVEPVAVGAVYIEQDLGSDDHGDTFQLTFSGGAPGTQLTRVLIDGDQGQAGFGVGDVIFDTREGDLGADQAFDFTLVRREGIDQVQWRVLDGSSQLELTFVGFDAGESLIFSIDVDEVEHFDAATADLETINDSLDPIASGIEFQGSRLTAEFTAPHFESASVTSEFLNRYDPLLDETSLDLPRDDEDGQRDRTAGTAANLVQQVLPAALSGHVYHDRNQDGRRQADEEGIAGVTVQLQPITTIVPQSNVTVTTDSNGAYSFTGLAPGTYRLVEEQPEGYLDGLDRAGTVAGLPSGTAQNPGDTIVDVVLPGGGQGADYDFGELVPVSLSGQVHLATAEGDCFSQDVQHQPVVGALVQLLDATGQLVAETRTNEQGNYQFLDLAPGVYSLVEVTPAGLFDGGAQAGQVDGQTVGQVTAAGRIDLIRLESGQTGIGFEFCEQEPASLRGRVQLSTPDGDCLGETEAHQPVAGVRIDLLDVNGAQVATTTTDSQGSYVFLDLPPGDYSVVEHTPPEVLDGSAHVGQVDGLSVGRVNGTSRIDQIHLGPGQQGEDFIFCEHLPASLTGTVFHDRNHNGLIDPGEEGIAQVGLQLLDGQDRVVQMAQSDSQGQYHFAALPAGQYRLREIQPSGWKDGLDRAGTIGGRTVGRAHNPGDEITAIDLRWGDQAVDYTFGELRPASLQGEVHLATAQGDCYDESLDHMPVADALVQLLDQQGQLLRQTRTDAAGQYVFLDLLPGTYQVRELTPEGLINGVVQVGSVDGQIVGQPIDPDTIGQIELRSGQQGSDYNFCEQAPAELSGHVYHDQNNNGRRDSDETGLADVQLQLLDPAGMIVARTTSDHQGRYAFGDLIPGQYTLVEQQPPGWLDGRDAAGTVDGQPAGRADSKADTIRNIVLGSGQRGVDFDFGELLPGSIRGIVHSDLIANCLLDEGELLLSGVRIDLLDEVGRQVATTQTDDDGRFHFDQLRPGTYTLRQHQPADYFDGQQRAGTGGGTIDLPNQIGQVVVQSGQDLVDYAFCEEPPGEISGRVFQDGQSIRLQPGESLPDDISQLRDGQYTDDDRPLAGVLLQLRFGLTARPFYGREALPGAYAPHEPITVRTDSNGFYRFVGLPKGTYAIYEIQPAGYLDGIDTGGTVPPNNLFGLSAAIAVNRHDPISPAILSHLETDPQFDAIIRIGLPPGQVSEQNNFSEVQIDRFIVPTLEVPQPAPSASLPSRSLLQPQPLPTARVLELPDYKVKSFGRSRGGHTYTWHLSVINGGHPRGEGTIVQQRGPVWYVGHTDVQYGWHGRSMRELHWSLQEIESQPYDRLFGLSDGIPISGDFNGDGTSECGVFYAGQWFIDINGNGKWDDGDLWAKLGHQGDLPVTGDWDGDGKDDIGIFGRAWPGDPQAVRAEPGLPDHENTLSQKAKNLPPKPYDAPQGSRALQLTATGGTRSDLIDHVFHFGAVGDFPIVGDWNGDGVHTIGVFHKGRWHLDLDGDGNFTAVDIEAQFGSDGAQPIAGDFNGDGVDEIGFYHDGRFVIDINRNYRLDAHDKIFAASSPSGYAVVGDWNGDGVADVSVVRVADEQPVTREARQR